MISNIYDNQEAQIRINNSLSRKVKIKQGVRQGCILSPILVNMYSEEVINSALESEKGIVINGKRFIDICYPDDTVILASSVHDLQRMLNSIVRVSRAFGMELNAKKTKVMAIEKSQRLTSK